MPEFSFILHDASHFSMDKRVKMFVNSLYNPGIKNGSQMKIENPYDVH